LPRNSKQKNIETIRDWYEGFVDASMKLNDYLGGERFLDAAQAIKELDPDKDAHMTLTIATNTIMETIIHAEALAACVLADAGEEDFESVANEHLSIIRQLKAIKEGTASRNEMFKLIRDENDMKTIKRALEVLVD